MRTLRIFPLLIASAVALATGVACSGTEFDSDATEADVATNAEALVHRHGRPARSELSPVGRYATELLRRPVTGRAQLNLVFILDGMRPDLVNETDTPNLFRLRREGVEFSNSHAVFPTVTRVNSPSIATGNYPGNAGVIGNSIVIPELNPTAALNTGDWRTLTALDELAEGRLLFVPSLAERLHAEGKSLAAVSSGSSGSAYLLNHRAQQGVGVFVNGYLEDGNGRVAFPDTVDTAIRSRFGAPPPKDETEAGLLGPVDWAEDVLREYVIPELRPNVVLNWITQPDGAHHSFGTGSPEGTLVIRNDDRNIGLILAKLEELGLSELTNIFVVSDHGFGVDTFQVNAVQSLVDAGLKASTTSDDVVLASNSQAVTIHVEGSDPRRIRDIVRHYQSQPWAGPIFTRAKRRGHGHSNETDGWISGTFSLDLIHLENAERGADICVTFEWSSEKNAFGIPGTDTTLTSGATGPRSGNASGHGSMSPWTVHNTFFAWGVDFKNGIVNRTPASNVDLAPTIAALNGLDMDGFDGRVLVEALEGGPDYEKLPIETKTLMTEAEDLDFRTVIQITELGHQRYIDKSWRLP